MDSYREIQLPLSQMSVGQTGTIVGILSGRGLMRRLEALGIRTGKRITKTSSAVFRGPVTLKIGSTQVAVGFGMANKIIVEVDKDLPGDFPE